MRIAGKVLKVKGQGHDHSECYSGRGMHFDGVRVELTCCIIKLVGSLDVSVSTAYSVVVAENNCALPADHNARGM